MTETKWTKGQWSLPHFAEPDINCECKYVLSDYHMGAIASVHCSGEGNDWLAHGDNPRFEEAVANAHLIAAAPDLYAALDGLIAPGDGGVFATRNLIDAAKAALAKARGEAQ